MPRNVEIKARVRHREEFQRRTAALAGAGPERIRQEDTFFHCPTGRLKLRTFAGGRGELIAYQRDDRSGPSTSRYVLAAVPEASSLEEALARSLGVLGRVSKERWLYLHGATRIHLDRVAGLGDFMELEVVLAADQEEAEGARIATDLMRRLGIPEQDRVSGAYLDLLHERKG